MRSQKGDDCMSNSSLVNYIALSPNRTAPRTGKITKITPHHMAGNLTVEQCGNVFASSERQASSNYGIGTDGRIGMYVEEKNRSWASSNAANDHVSVTIEVANSTSTDPWPISDKAWDSLVNLCADICKRNGIKSLSWTGDKDGSLTCHYMFASTACPGPTLKGRMQELANTVNARLKNSEVEDLTKAETTALINDLVPGIVNKILDGNGTTVDDWAKEEFAAAVAQGITSGERPRGYTTRQEAAILAVRAQK